MKTFSGQTVADPLRDDVILILALDTVRQRFLPAQRYASAGNSDRNVSVCPSVRPSRAGIVSKRIKLAA